MIHSFAIAKKGPSKGYFPNSDPTTSELFTPARLFNLAGRCDNTEGAAAESCYALVGMDQAVWLGWLEWVDAFWFGTFVWFVRPTKTTTTRNATMHRMTITPERTRTSTYRILDTQLH